MNKLPKARNENIVVQNLADEVLIYDMMTNKAFCLNETSANVFNHCDGETSFDELKNKYKYTDEIIFLALDELKEKDLLDSAADYQTPFAGMNRREVIRKVGLATMVALPLISSITAPKAVNAASGTCGATANGSSAGIATTPNCAISAQAADDACRAQRGSQCQSCNAVYDRGAPITTSPTCTFRCTCAA